MPLSHQPSVTEVLHSLLIKQWMETLQQISIETKHAPIQRTTINHGGKLISERFIVLQGLRSQIEWTVVERD